MSEQLVMNGYELAAVIFSLLAGFALIMWASKTSISFENWDKLTKEERKKILNRVLE